MAETEKITTKSSPLVRKPVADSEVGIEDVQIENNPLEYVDMALSRTSVTPECAFNVEDWRLRADVLSLRMQLTAAEGTGDTSLRETLDKLEKVLEAHTVPEEWKESRATLIKAAQEMADAWQPLDKDMEVPKTKEEDEKQQKAIEDMDKPEAVKKRAQAQEEALQVLEGTVQKALCLDALKGSELRYPLFGAGTDVDGDEERRWLLFAEEMLVK